MSKKSANIRVKRSDQEPIEAVRSRAKRVLSILKREFPGATTALLHHDPFQLMIATILSAQCTDERVNLVTPSLFKRYPTARDFAKADPPELENMIRSTGFFRAKTKSIINCSKALLSKFDGAVPSTMEDLTLLPGVGRKTANVVLGNAFGKAEGIVVDTHVARLSVRLGFSPESNPERIEMDLLKIIPRRDWIATGNLLILHGRKTCKARKPACPQCPVNELCPSAML